MEGEVQAESEVPAGAAMLRDKVGGAVPGAMPLLLKGSIIPDVAEPEANRTDDPDSCLQYTVNAVSGERAAPPKTEDGTDTEEVDASLAMVYVRIHTGGSLPSTSSVKTEEFDPAQAGTAAAAEDGGSTAHQAEAGPEASTSDAAAATSGSEAKPSQQVSCSEAEAAAAAAAAAATGEAASAAAAAAPEPEAPAQPPHWVEVYKDVLQQIHSCRVSDEERSGLQDTQAASIAGAVSSTQQEQQEVQAVQDHTCVLEKHASSMAAKAIASACMEQASTSQPSTPRRPGTGTSAGPGQVAASEATPSAPAQAVGPATPSTAGQPNQGAHAVSAVMPGAAAAAGVQESSTSGLRTPVVLPPDAADLPMQAVLDELDTLLAKSDELRSSVQLRSSRQVSGQHTSTHLSRRSSFSALDKPLIAAATAGVSAGSSILHSGRSTDWDEAARSSRRRSNSQPPAGDRGADAGSSSSSRSSELHSRVEGDMEDSLDRSVLDSVEVRDEIRQHLQMIISTGSRQDKQEDAGRRDAATSVGGLITPRSAQQPATGSPLSNGGGAAAQDHFSPASMATRSIGAAALASSFSREASLNRSGSGVERSEAGMARRSSSSRYGGTETGSSMDKLHALYARLMSDTASHRRSSASESVQQGASSNGMRPARRTGSMASGMAVPAASPMRNSVPYPLVLSGAKLTDAGGGRRWRSVSPQKKDHQRAHVLSHNNLQQQQQQHQQEPQQQQGCQLRHSLSLCSSCGNAMHRDVSGISGSSGLPAAGSPAAAVHSVATAAASTGAAGVPAGAADVTAMGIRTVSDMLPSTHISIAGLMSGGLVAAGVAHWEGQTSPTPGQQPPAPGSPTRAAATSRGASPVQRGRPPQRGLSKSAGGPNPGADPSQHMSAGGRGALSTSPVRSGRGSGGGSYNERFASRNDKAARSASTSPARRAGSTSPRRGLATAPAPGGAVQMSSEGVGVTQISFGQLLQETALQQALGQLQHDAVSPRSYAEQSQSTPSASPAVTAGLDSEEFAGSGLLQESSSTMQVLKTVPEDGVVIGPATTEAVPRRTHSRSNSRHRLMLPAQLDSSPAPEVVQGGIAAAALHELAHGMHADHPRALVHSQSLPTNGTADSRRSSCTDRHMTVSSSMRSRASTISSSSSRVWRPGGNRTDPRDDYKKLQTYESARLRALQKQCLLSPGCSTRLMLPADDLDGADPGSVSPKSRRSTADNLAAPVSPGAPSGYCSTPASPSGVSHGSYAAASLRRKNSIAAAAAAGSVSPGLLRTSSSASPGVSPARAAAAKPAGPRSVLEPAHTAITLAALAGDSPPAPQRSASPRLRKVEKPRQQQQQQQQPDVWQSLTGKPCPKSLMPMMQRLQHQHATASPRHKMSYSSISAQSSPERLLRSGAKTHPASRSLPSSGNSTTAQVEEAIRAAQAALREKQQQVSQVRQALHGKWAGGARARSLSPGARQQPMSEDEACAGVLTDSLVSSSVWGGSSCASSYTGKAPQLAAAQQHGTENSAAPGADSQAQAAAEAQADAGLIAQLDAQAQTHSRPSSRQHGALATVSAPVGLSAQAAVHSVGHEASTQSAVGSGPEAPAERLGDVGSAVATEIPVQAGAAKVVQAAGSPRAAHKPVHAKSGRFSPESPRILKAYTGPVIYHNRHRSQSPKRRPMSALEALLKVAPDADPPQQHARPSSAEPALTSQLSAGRLGSAVAASRRSSQHNPGQLSKLGSVGSSPPSQAVPQGLGKGIATGSHRRSSDGGRSVTGYVAEPWSAPRQRTASGLTGEQLMELHRRTSAAEAAEAAAAAAEGDTEVAGCAEHAMPLDVLVRAYTALNKKNKNSGERAAAVAMLLDRITEGSTYVSDGLVGKVTPRSGTPDLAQQPTNVSVAAEQSQQKLRSSPLQLDVLGRGLMPESPRGAGPGSTAGPASPSSIIQTLKQDSLSSWHRVSPERQAAHASLLATPKHRHANSYAADLAALAAGRSSTNLHSGDKSVQRSDSPAGGALGSAGKQQQPGSVSAGPAEAPACTASSAKNTPAQHTREGSMTGAANREQGPVPAQPECMQPAASAPRPMVETATGRLVLDSIGAQDITVSAALAWLKSGLQNPDAAPPAAPAEASLQHKPHPRSPRRQVHHVRPCSPFTCGIFGGAPRTMVRSNDDEAEAATAAAASTQQPKPQQPPQAQPQPQQQLQAGANGVTFEMGSDNRLVMVVQQQGALAPQRLQVTGVRLRHEEAGHLSQAGTSSSADGAVSVGGSAICNSMLDLLTTGGSHTIELAGESDWAGLLVGLNAMLLLLEQESPEAAEKLGSMPMSQVAWSMAVAGLDS